MSINQQQLGQSFAGVAVFGNVPAGQALQKSGPSADLFLGLGADPYGSEQTYIQPAPLDGCALKAE
jgi:hypothetical protein